MPKSKVSSKASEQSKKTDKKEKEVDMTCIESDTDFDTKGLDEIDVEILDKMVDKRPSGFWKMTWLEVVARLILWAVVVYINEKGWVNPHDPNFIWADFKITKFTQ